MYQVATKERGKPTGEPKGEAEPVQWVRRGRKRKATNDGPALTGIMPEVILRCLCPRLRSLRGGSLLRP